MSFTFHSPRRRMSHACGGKREGGTPRALFGQFRPVGALTWVSSLHFWLG